MSEYTQTTVYSLFGVNAELSKIQKAINESVSTEENGNRTMRADLDMNSNRILNLPKPLTDTEPLRLKDISVVPDSLIVHDALLGRGELDQHPISSITNLSKELGSNSRTKDLYYYGGTFQGDCIAAMNAALADPNTTTIIVPDNVTLGRHVFDCDTKVIIGGKNVSFAGVSAGLYPRVVKHVEIRNFVNATLPVFPMSGGVQQEGGVFVSTITGMNIGNLIIENNSCSNGRAGVLIGPESPLNGVMTGKVIVRGNKFSFLNGIEPGTGYGIQVANGNGTADIVIDNNTIVESNRNGIYIARNDGANPIRVTNNRVIDHRKNATNKVGVVYPAFNLARASNIYGEGNQVVRPTNGSLLIQPEDEAPFALDSRFITWKDFTILDPVYTSAQIYIGYISQTGSPLFPRLTDVRLEGITMRCTQLLVPLVDYAFGRNIQIKDVNVYFVGATNSTGLFYLSGGTAIDSGDVKIENVRVTNQNPGIGTYCSVVLLTGVTQSLQIPIVVDGVSSYGVFENFQEFEHLNPTVSNGSLTTLNTQTRGLTLAPGVTLLPQESGSIQYPGRKFSLGVPTPNGVLTPKYVGEKILATDSQVEWTAYGTTNTSWRADFTGRVFALGVANPNGVVVPRFAGDVIVLTDLQQVWQSFGTANNTWIRLG